MNNLIGILIGTASSRPTISFDYVDLPNRPALGTSATLVYSSPGNILNSTGGTTQDKILSGAWQQFHAFSFTGDSTNHRRISNENSSTIIGSIANHLFTREGTDSDYFEINGKSASEPLYFEDVGGVAATSAIQISAFATGPHVWVSNIVNNSRGYAVFANTAGTLSGGDANTAPTSSANYQDIVLSFIRSFNVLDNKEHFYIGATTTNTYAIHHAFSGKHLLGYNCEWDGLQVLNATDFVLSNLTIVNSGTDGETNDAQDSNIQVQNAYGIVANSIFYNAPQAARFSTYDLVFRNNYVHWTGNELEDAVQIVGYVENYASGNRLMPSPVGKEILIENCDFVADNWAGALIQVLDGEVNITVKNCRIEGPTSLFDTSGIGVSPTGTLTDGGGNTFVSSGTIPAPTFTNFTPTDFENHGKLTQSYHYNKGRGFRTPILEVVSSESISDVSVPFGTTFAELLSTYLPAAADLILDDASTVEVTVNWLEGPYDENTASTYALTGTVDILPDGVSNLDNIGFAVNVIVEEEAFDTDYQAVLDRATTLGYTLPSSGQQDKQNQLVLDLKSAGIWDELDLFYVFQTDGSSNFSLLNWKSPTTFQGVLSATVPTFTSNSGWAGNGFSSYIDLNWIPSTHGVNYTQNDAAILVGVATNVSSNTDVEFGATQGGFTNRTTLNTRTTSNTAFIAINGNNTTEISNASSVGNYILQRTSSTAVKLFKDGTQLGSTASLTSTGLPTDEMHLLEETNVGNQSARRITHFGAGASLAGLESAFQTAWTTYIS